jgi:hypothetical protein
MRWPLLLVALSACSSPHPDPSALIPGAPCQANETRCSGAVYQTCEQGHFADREDCGNPHAPKRCDARLGCIDCEPGKPYCVGADLFDCTSVGTQGALQHHCVAGCIDGHCSDPCMVAAAQKSYIGCDYWPVDLHNGIDIWANPTNAACGDGSPGAHVPFTTGEPLCYVMTAGGPYAIGLCDYGGDCAWTGRPDIQCGSGVPACSWNGQHSPFAIVVANVAGEDPAEVMLTNASGQAWNGVVPAHGLLTILPQSLGFPDQSLFYSGIEPKAYHLVSSRPLVAYQFNPLDNAFMFSADASLLLPTHTLDKFYLAMSWPTFVRAPSMHDSNGFVAAVATAPGDTTLTVSATGAVRAGIQVPAFGPNATHTFTLHQFDTLNLEAGEGQDLTGTRITADQPFALFGGHAATDMTPYQCCLDHLEEQIYPTAAWGKHYAIAHSQPRPNNQPDLVRVLGFREFTTISVAPGGGTPCPTLAGGQFCDISMSRDLELTASEPVLVGHYLASSGGRQIGDPSLSLPAPAEQFRKAYTFLVPHAYRENYISLVVATGGSAKLDGQDVTNSLTPFPSTAFQAARIPVGEGPHTVDCPSGCGLEVYGYDTDVSYMFTGGLDLNPLVVP